MTIPVDIVAAVLPVFLAAWIGWQVFLFKRIARVEQKVLTIVIMLRDRGFRMPGGTDTERLLRRDKF